MDLEKFKEKTEDIMANYGYAFIIADGWAPVVFNKYTVEKRDNGKIWIKTFADDPSSSLTFSCPLDSVYNVVEKYC